MKIFKVNSIVFRVILTFCLVSMALEPILAAAMGGRSSMEITDYIFLSFLLAIIIMLTIYDRVKDKHAVKWLGYTNIVLCSLWTITCLWSSIELIGSGEYLLLSPNLLFFFLGGMSIWGLLRDLMKIDADDRIGH